MYKLTFIVDGGGLGLLTVTLFVSAEEPQAALQAAQKRLRRQLATGVAFGLQKMRLANREEQRNHISHSFVV